MAIYGTREGRASLLGWFRVDGAIDKQDRFTSLGFWLGPEGPPPPQPPNPPVITPGDGTTHFLSTIIAMTAEVDTVIIYTIDGSDPRDPINPSRITYQEPFEITASTTFMATARRGDLYSGLRVVSITISFEIPEEPEEPIDIIEDVDQSLLRDHPNSIRITRGDHEIRIPPGVRGEL